MPRRKDERPRPRLVVVSSSSDPKSREPAKPKRRPPTKPKRSRETIKKKKERSDVLDDDAWKGHANGMGYAKASEAQRVYIERAARLKVIVEAKYRAWSASGFEDGGGKEYLAMEKEYGAALKAAGINPANEQEVATMRSDDGLVQ